MTNVIRTRCEVYGDDTIPGVVPSTRETFRHSIGAIKWAQEDAMLIGVSLAVQVIHDRLAYFHSDFAHKIYRRARS